MEKIRNFCIIAHIDHGKSTLADRFLELTRTVPEREMKEQLLDQMDLERERGITIKLQPVKMEYNGYVLNLIDTPGHVDFTYEVSRSLQAVEGAILLIDATQGIEAQTLSNLYLALDQNLEIIPVINKIDLPNANVSIVKTEIKKLLGCEDNEILLSSGKSGQGVPEVLDAVISRVPPPKPKSKSPQALIFDSLYDDYRGVIIYARVFGGSFKKDDPLYLLGSNKNTHSLEVGIFSPKFKKTEKLSDGEIGYIVTGFKDVSNARVGDTVTNAIKRSEPLPGYRQVKPMVFAGIFAESGDEYPKLRDAMSEINLTDASLTFETEHSPALGFGYRCGFLGMLHLEIIAERLRREYSLNLIITTPSVAYEVILKNGDKLKIHSPMDLPDRSEINEIREPWVKAEIVSPKEYLGPIMEQITSQHGILGKTDYLDETRIVQNFEMPLSGLITRFYDKIKSVSRGYASLNYEMTGFKTAEVVKLNILVAEEPVEAFSILVHRKDAYEAGKRIIKKLKEIIPKHQFVVKLQASIGGKIVAAERIPAMRKDVTAKLYGGDVTRKRKLLEKQKKGKKKMMQSGSVDIPPKAFLEVLKS